MYAQLSFINVSLLKTYERILTELGTGQYLLWNLSEEIIFTPVSLVNTNYTRTSKWILYFFFSIIANHAKTWDHSLT
jgi:hypothetical protein